MNETIEKFLQADTEKLAEIIEQYPRQIPVKVIAEWWGCGQDSLRSALEQQGILGMGFRQSGKLNRAFVIPTGHFVRWYLNIKTMA